jgi:Zn-dependent protease with chaperone function
MLPAQHLRHLWLAIFSTFAMLGFVLDILTRGRQPVTLLALNVIFSGLFAVGYALVSMPMRKWGYAAMVAAHMTYVFVIPRLFTLHASGSPGRLTLDAVGIIVTVAFGYTSFLRFISVTATRYVRAQGRSTSRAIFIVSSCRQSRNELATSITSAGRTRAATSAATSWTSSNKTTSGSGTWLMCPDTASGLVS